MTASEFKQRSETHAKCATLGMPNICVCACISMRAHLYMNSYIHDELLIYSHLQGFISDFETFL